MAPRAHDLVPRGDAARALRARPPAPPPGLRVRLQLLLRGRRRARGPPGARVVVAAHARRRPVVPRGRRRAHRSALRARATIPMRRWCSSSARITRSSTRSYCSRTSSTSCSRSRSVRPTRPSPRSDGGFPRRARFRRTPRASSTSGCRRGTPSRSTTSGRSTTPSSSSRASSRSGRSTCAEYQTFIDEGGYRDARLWLSDGWDTVRREAWTAPLYWRDGAIDTLHGTRAIDPDEPVVPRELLRGRRVRALGRRAAPDRTRVGIGRTGRAARARPALRERPLPSPPAARGHRVPARGRVGMDAKSLSALPGLRALPWRSSPSTTGSS